MVLKMPPPDIFSRFFPQYVVPYFHSKHHKRRKTPRSKKMHQVRTKSLRILELFSFFFIFLKALDSKKSRTLVQKIINNFVKQQNMKFLCKKYENLCSIIRLFNFRFHRPENFSGFVLNHQYRLFTYLVSSEKYFFWELLKAISNLQKIQRQERK